VTVTTTLGLLPFFLAFAYPVIITEESETAVMLKVPASVFMKLLSQPRYFISLVVSTEALCKLSFFKEARS